jgi:hypothetical protein
MILSITYNSKFRDIIDRKELVVYGEDAVIEV